METLFEVLKYTLPSLVVFATSYLIIKTFIENDQKKRKMELRMANLKTITPVKLQAYERLTIFLERIAPESIIIRIMEPNMTSAQLQSSLLKVIRAEFEHNVSQQVYVSSQAWSVIKTSKEQTIKLINTSIDKVDRDSPAINLSRTILETVISMKSAPNQAAIDFLKGEIQQIF
jgi:hypothetical protein